MNDTMNKEDGMVLTPEQLNEQATVEKLRIKSISRAKLVKLASELTGYPKVSLAKLPAMELTARHPYQETGFVDFYHPGRWDCESDSVFMNAIVSTGPSAGQWDGTVGYARFKAPKAGNYLIVINFSGYQTTMRLYGPWGTNTAYTATTADSGAVTALWTATKGQQVFFNLSCTAPILGYLKSIQVFVL